MNRLRRILSVILLAVLCVFPGLAAADGLSDLRSALQRLQGSTPLMANVTVKTQRRQGEGRELQEDSGQATVLVEQGAQGLRLQYDAETLARTRAEDLAKESSATAKMPTVYALNVLSYRYVHELTEAADALTRTLLRSTFKSERSEPWNGKPARLLIFDVELIKQTERESKYIKKHEGSLDVWIGADGTPLASRQRHKVSGRAFVFVKFESSTNEDVAYATVGERLVAVRKQLDSAFSGAGEQVEEHTELLLQVQP